MSNNTESTECYPITCSECNKGKLELLNNNVFSCPKCKSRFSLSVIKGWGNWK